MESPTLANVISILGIGVVVINSIIGFVLTGMNKRLERLENLIMFGDCNVKERRTHVRQN